MSKIGDELRDYCKKVLCYTHYYDKFWYFADRIDSEMVELPRDADGETIHIGDVLTDGKYTFTAYELAVYGDGSWSIRNEDGSAWYACDVTHRHEPTVEDVLREMLDAWGELPLNATDEAIIAEYAAKLRLAGEDE